MKHILLIMFLCGINSLTYAQKVSDIKEQNGIIKVETDALKLDLFNDGINLSMVKFIGLDEAPTYYLVLKTPSKKEYNFDPTSQICFRIGFDYVYFPMEECILDNFVPTAYIRVTEEQIKSISTENYAITVPVMSMNGNQTRVIKGTATLKSNKLGKTISQMFQVLNGDIKIAEKIINQQKQSNSEYWEKMDQKWGSGQN